MKLYDNTISKVMNLVNEYGHIKELGYMHSDWPTVTDRSMILRGDMAYELGTGHNEGLGLTLITADKSLVPHDDIELIGDNLSEIEHDRSYARIAVVRVDEEALGTGQSLYNTIRDLEYVRYHFYPKGFMMRISASRNKESVRIGRSSIDEGLGFETTGSMMIEQFNRKPMVEATRIIYVNADDFDYKTLASLGREGEDITQTIDHMLKNVLMDCEACSLQKICDEVEGLRELHFSR